MENELWYRRPATLWNEALPVGNGKLGAMVFGGVGDDRIALNHDTLWSGYPKRERMKEVHAARARAEALALAGDTAAAQAVLEREVCGDFFESYLPMGTLLARDGFGGEARAYRRFLDLDTACAGARYEAGSARVERRLFASAPDDALVLEWRFSVPGDLTLRLESPLRSENRSGEYLALRGQCPSRVEPSYVRHPDPIRYDDTHPGVRFAVGARVRTDGAARTEDGCLFIRGATRVLAVLLAETSFVDFKTDPADETWACEARLNARLAACDMDGERMLRAHIADYARLEGACRFRLGGREDARASLPADERLRAFDGRDKGLYELLFRYGRYLLIASSREGAQPANLQGVWNAELRAPWSANYTLNINTEMNYWPAFSTGLSRCALPLVKLTDELRVTGGEVARAVHGAPGFCAHHNTDLWRAAAPVGNHQAGCACYGYWPMGGAWLCRAVWEYYDYTRDDAYLRDTGYPIMESAARFILHQLRENARGELVLCPATSSENNYLARGETLAVDESTTMIQSIAEDLLENICLARRALGMPPDAKTLNALRRLRKLTAGGDGRVLEWAREREEAEPRHRHLSHLYALYPGGRVRADSAEADACRRSLEARGDEGTGWSLAWKVCLWARLHDGERALRLLSAQLRPVAPQTLDTFAGGGSYPNLLCAHPPFQIDGNLGAVAGVMAMLLEADGGRVTLLPALPGAWTDGSLKGARAPGGWTLSFSWRSGRLTSATVASAFGGDIVLCCRSREAALSLRPGQTLALRGDDLTKQREESE